MKQFRVVLTIALMMLLSGCSVPVWETVEDVMPPETVMTWQESSYVIQVGLPEGVELVEQSEHAAVYATANGELEVETQKFLTSGLDGAVCTLSGFEAEELTILQTSRFDLPEYQFAWVSQTEQGTRLYRADLVLDGTCCYAVVCSSLESAGDYYAFQARQVFSSFGLSQGV